MAHFPPSNLTLYPRSMAACVVALMLVVAISPLRGAELLRITPENYDAVVPAGKEVDAIYGDFVLRNDEIVVVVAAPVPDRKANMTVRNVGGCIIDMTERDQASDQLSAYYPGGGRVTYLQATVLNEDGSWMAPTDAVQIAAASSVQLRCTAPATDKTAEVHTAYRLDDHSRIVHVTTEFVNPHDSAVTVLPQDSFRTDRSFTSGWDRGRALVWIDDAWWRQCYGIMSMGTDMHPNEDSIKRARPLIPFHNSDQPQVSLQPGASFRYERIVFPAANHTSALGLADQLRGRATQRLSIQVADGKGPISRAHVLLRKQGQDIGSGLTQDDGRLVTEVPRGTYELVVSANGRPHVSQQVELVGDRDASIAMELPGYVAGRITDQQGQAIACKVELRGVEGTRSPDLGPDTEVWGVQNLIYSENGTFQHDVPPGTYETIVSHGPEYDAIFGKIVVQRGQVATIEGTLVRSVDTKGWISSDFHSHSTPSGDNTSSQLGRVLNLLAEHVEFAPCTEHNRISTYVPHLERLGAVERMATCTGMELTGSLLPVNHQNAFPLHHHPHTQDGGGPQVDDDPVVQIERLAMWDQGSDKLVQENHPDLVQLYGDRELDGTADEGFRKMLGFMDVMEVHPLHPILKAPNPDVKKGMGNAVFHWMQLLNLGYRIPGVVNTDAHYTFHGSGGLRNFLHSPTDRPAEIDTMEMVHSAEHGHSTMTNGPFLEVSAASGQTRVLPGDDLKAEQGKVQLHIRVQCPNWHTINRVQIVVNGKLIESLNFTHENARDKFRETALKFDETIPLELSADSHVIVVATGQGLKLGPVVGPAQQDEEPIAVSNPIFVDVDGDGFTANQDLLGYPLPGVTPATE